MKPSYRDNILSLICDAQIASDSGKGIEDIPVRTNSNDKALEAGYKKKEHYILAALKAIDKHPPCGINYYVQRTGDQNGYPSVLVYFDIKLDGQRLQVSFHNPYNRTSQELDNYIGKGRPTRWTGEIGGSRKAVFKIQEYLKNKKEMEKMANIDSKKLAENTLYAGYFFSREDVDKFLSTIPKREGLAKDIKDTHVTVVFKPADIVPGDVGSKAGFIITGYGNDGKNEGFKLADTTEITPYAQAELQKRQAERKAADLGLHITTSISKDGKAVDTAFLDFKDIPKPMQISGTFCIATKDGKILSSPEEVEKYMEELEKKEKEQASVEKIENDRQANFDKYCSSKVIGQGIVVNSGGIDHFFKVNMPGAGPTVTEKTPNVFLSDTPDVDVSMVGGKISYHITGYNNYGCIQNVELTIDDKAIKPEVSEHLQGFMDIASRPTLTISCFEGIPQPEVHTDFSEEQSSKSVIRGTVGILVEGKNGPEWLTSQDDIDRFIKKQIPEQTKSFKDMSVKEKVAAVSQNNTSADNRPKEVVIYWDMDGVVADLDKGVKEMTSFDTPPSRDCSKEDKNRFWSEVNNAGGFYAKLDEVPGTIDVLKAQKDAGIRTEILTGIPLPKSVPSAADDKVQWASEHIGSDVPVNTCMAKDKIQKCTGPESILIDDSEKNCQAWRDAGGTAILFTGDVEKLKTDIQQALSTLEHNKERPLQETL